MLSRATGDKKFFITGDFKGILPLMLFLFFYNNLVNLLPAEFHAKIYVPLNFFIIILLIIFSKKFFNLTFSELGYDSKYLVRGILYGLTSSLIIILLFISLLYLLPKLGFTIKPPIVMIGTEGDLLYKLLIRIPLGTAFFEENLFRGILYGCLIKKDSIRKSFFIISSFFAFWHIVPALKVINSNFHMGLSLVGIIMFLTGIIGAFIAGLFFAILRYKGKSIIACIISHALINDLALIIIIYLWK